MKKYKFQASFLALLYGFSLSCSFDQGVLGNKKLQLKKLEERNFGVIESPSLKTSFTTTHTPGLTSVSSTPNSVKLRAAGLSPLDLNGTSSCFSEELDPEIEEFRRKINMFDMTPGSAHWLGQKLLQFKSENLRKKNEVVQLIELLHNNAAAPLKFYFRNEQGELDKCAYNQFLEKSLPRISDEDQSTPLVKSNTFQKNNNRQKNRSVFESDFE